MAYTTLNKMVTVFINNLIICPMLCYSNGTDNKYTFCGICPIAAVCMVLLSRSRSFS